MFSIFVVVKDYGFVVVFVDVDVKGDFGIIELKDVNYKDLLYDKI